MTREITIKVRVFEDPEYCCETLHIGLKGLPKKHCPHLKTDGSCGKFDTGHAENYLFLTKCRRFEKCNLCKEAYAKQIT